MNFNHRFGCQKCTVVGRFYRIAHGMSFPQTNCELRTDLSFRRREHPEHHIEHSIIENLPIDMIRDFPTSDPLHLLELGIMKK